MIALQQSAGNAAVSSLVARAPAAPVALPRPAAEDMRHDAAIATGLGQVARARGGELEAWRAAVSGAGAAIAPPRLQSVAETPDALAKAGADMKASVAAAGVAAQGAGAAPSPGALPAATVASPTAATPAAQAAATIASPAAGAAGSPAGDVTARLLARVPELAQAIVDAAARELDPSKRVAELRPLADRLLPPLQQQLTAELQQIAAAATATVGEVESKVAAQQQQAAQEHEQAEQKLGSVADAIEQVLAQAQAVEARYAQQTQNQLSGDLAMLERFKGELAAGNREAVKAEIARMSAQQQAVITAFLQSGGTDALGAVAVGLAERLKQERLQTLADELKDSAIKELEWEPLNALGRAVNPSFDAGIEAREVRAAVKGWGTDEKRLLTALSDRTPIQIAAMRKAYKAVFERDMDEDIDDDLSGSEQDRADALRSGDPIAGAVATLRDAMDGAGTDEQLIFQTLRGESPADRTAIVAAYKAKYGVDLKADLEDEMSGYELGQSTALLDGDTTKADAMALKDAMAGIGTDEAGINTVYARIRDEVEAQAGAKGWKSDQVEAEIKRRTAELKRTYDTTFRADLRQDFDSELSGGELDYALAEQDDDRTGMDAATLRIEHMSMWTSDDKVNEVLKAQYLRATREIKRDSPKLSPAEVERLAHERSKQYMAALQQRYDATALTGSFDGLIENEVSGYSQDEAKERIASGGHLSDAAELKYAIFGPGTNEQTIDETLKGKSKAEIEQLKKAYLDLTGNDLLADLKGDLSGRAEADATILLETGDSTPQERMNYLKARKQWELTEGTGSGGVGATSEEARVLEATTKEAEAAYAHYAQNPDDANAKDRAERWLGYGEKDIERHREELDSAADRAAMITAIAVGLVVTMATAGAAGPAVAAAVGALASTAASMAVKQDMKGGAYGGEDMAIEVVQGLADALVQAGTAGVGKAALEALAGTEAFAVVGRAARGGTFARLAVGAGESGVEGLVQGVPSGVLSAVMDKDTWHDPDPIGAIVRAAGRTAAHSATMGAGMGAAGEGVAHALGGGGHAAGGGGHEGAGGGRRTPLPEGHVVDGLTHETATAAYEQARDHTPDREVAIWEHYETGEPIVVQGGKASTSIDPAIEPRVGEDNYGSRQHFHTIDPETGLTPEESLYPSAGPDGDMQRARGDARRAKREWSARIEVVTKDGSQWVEYGFDPNDPERRYWIRPPKGLGEPARFASEYEYMRWVERQQAIRRGETPTQTSSDTSPDTPRPPDPPPPSPASAKPPADDPEVDDFFADYRKDLDEPPPGRAAPDEPVIDDEPTEVDGGDSFSDLPTGEFVDEPTIQELRPDPDLDPPRDVDDEPTHADIALEDLPPGSVMYSDTPLTAAEAREMYINAIADGEGKLEVMILRNSRSGERIVIQGSDTRVKPAQDAWKDFVAEDGKGGRWIPERHYHPIGPDATTAATSRVPSGRGGDMEGAKDIAVRQRTRHEEHLDLADAGAIAFGYDPAEAKPYFVRRPGEAYRYFKTLESYHEWAEGHIGEPLPEIKKTEGRAAATEETDESARDIQPDVPGLRLPPGDDSMSGADLLTKYGSADEVWMAARDGLGELKSGMDPANLPRDWWVLDEVLANNPSSVNERMRELVPIVIEGLHDADLYADVMAEAWSELKARADTGGLGDRDINDALADLAARDGAPIVTIPRELGVMDPDEFFRRFVAVRAHVVDIAALKGADVHGVMPHMIQDLVINKALARAGRGETSADFKELLGQCRGDVAADAYKDQLNNYTFSAEKVAVGDFIWQLTYDLTEANHVNVPEEFRPLLGKLFGVR